MKSFLLITLLFVGSVSHADVITCEFTEPFIESIYEMKKSTLSYIYDSGVVRTIKNVSFLIKDTGSFELVDKDGKVLQTLKLNYEGSDGMSDRIFPYEVKDSSQEQMANSGIGGCKSEMLPVKDIR